MKTAMKRYTGILMLLLLWTSPAAAQFVLNDGIIKIGDCPGFDATCNIRIDKFHRMQWTNGNTALNANINGRRPAIYSDSDRIIRFYDTRLDRYDNVGAKTTFAFMYDDVLSGGGTSLTSPLGKIIGLDAVVVKDSAESMADMREEGNTRLGFTEESLVRSVPELTVTDEDGNRLVNLNSLVPLLVGTVQSLQQQADARERQIAMLKNTAASRQFKKTSGTTGIDVSKGETNTLYPVQPNPFKNRITVTYSIADNVRQAMLRVNDVNGRKTDERILTGRGKNGIRLDGHSWLPGIYFCSLIVDGEVISTQKIIKKH